VPAEFQRAININLTFSLLLGHMFYNIISSNCKPMEWTSHSGASSLVTVGTSKWKLDSMPTSHFEIPIRYPWEKCTQYCSTLTPIKRNLVGKMYEFYIVWQLSQWSEWLLSSKPAKEIGNFCCPIVCWKLYGPPDRLSSSPSAKAVRARCWPPSSNADHLHLMLR
jgi:hypothetical protein